MWAWRFFTTNFQDSLSFFFCILIYYNLFICLGFQCLYLCHSVKYNRVKFSHFGYLPHKTKCLHHMNLKKAERWSLKTFIMETKHFPLLHVTLPEETQTHISLDSPSYCHYQECFCFNERDYVLKMKGYQTCNFLNSVICDTNLVTQPAFLEQLFSSYYHYTCKMYDLQLTLL